MKNENGEWGIENESQEWRMKVKNGERGIGKGEQGIGNEEWGIENESQEWRMKVKNGE